jgi:hypothetical protein
VATAALGAALGHVGRWLRCGTGNSKPRRRGGSTPSDEGPDMVELDFDIWNESRPGRRRRRWGRRRQHRVLLRVAVATQDVGQR